MRTTHVGLAEWRVSRNPNEALCVLGLGSSVGLFVYDPVAMVAAATHIMLPRGRDADRTPTKYADTAVPFLLTEAAAAGAAAERVKVGVFGGATMLSQGHSALLEVGQRNVTAVLEALAQAGLGPTVTDVGGTRGRTVVLEVGTGHVTVKVLSQPDREYGELMLSPEVDG
jgi:chemotaxis protein CheD